MYVQISRYKNTCINSWHIELKYPKSTLVSCLRSTSSRSLPGNSHHSQAGRDLGRCAMLPGGGGKKGEGTRWHCGISSIINNSTKKSSKRCTVVQSFLSSVHWQYAKKFPLFDDQWGQFLADSNYQVAKALTPTGAKYSKCHEKQDWTSKPQNHGTFFFLGKSQLKIRLMGVATYQWSGVCKISSWLSASWESYGYRFMGLFVPFPRSSGLSQTRNFCINSDGESFDFDTSPISGQRRTCNSLYHSGS